MLMTINLSSSETANYATLRNDIRAYAKRLARKANRRFVQVVSSDGRSILDLLEVIP